MKRLSVTLSDAQFDALKVLMEKDLAHNMSGYIGTLVAMETTRRDKRPVGRPRKDDGTEEDEPRNIPNPNPMDVKDRPFLTQSEMDAINALKR